MSAPHLVDVSASTYPDGELDLEAQGRLLHARNLAEGRAMVAEHMTPEGAILCRCESHSSLAALFG